MKIKVLIFGITGIILWGCSWQQYFCITNNGSTEISVEYAITSAFSGFPIFESSPDFYKTTSSGKIDWENPLDSEKGEFSDTIIRFQLLPQTTAIIGHLSNDHYTAYNQYFINSRVFNLKYIRIINAGDTSVIVPGTFDRYFVNNNGFIELIVK